MQTISNPKFKDATENTFSKEELEYFKTVRIVLLMPIAERPEAATMKCACDMIAYSWHHGLKIFECGITERTVVDWARNQLAREALQREDPLEKKQYTHFLWVDSDMVFKPDMACQLARHKVDFVSVVYHCRSGPPLPLVYVHKEDDKTGYLHHNLTDIPQTLCKIDACGFGGCLINRKVFETTPEPWFTIDFNAGEDIAFCKRVRDFGHKIYVDGSYSVGHIGLPPVVGGKDFDKWKEENYEQYLKDRIPVQLGGK